LHQFGIVVVGWLVGCLADRERIAHRHLLSTCFFDLKMVRLARFERALFPYGATR